MRHSTKGKKVLSGILKAAGLLLLTVCMIPLSQVEAAAEQAEKALGLGETGESDFAITIDKSAPFHDPNMFYHRYPAEGFRHIRVDFTFKNVSDEERRITSSSGLYIVYKDSPDMDKRDWKGNDNHNAFHGNREGIYNSVTLQPGESFSAWSIYQMPSDTNEVTMRYYAPPQYGKKRAPELLFKFELGEFVPEPKPVLPEGALSMEDISGIYEYKDAYNTAKKLRVRVRYDKLMVQYSSGAEREYKYDPISKTASFSAKRRDRDPAYKVKMVFNRDGEKMTIAVDETNTHPLDRSVRTRSYEAYRIDEATE